MTNLTSVRTAPPPSTMPLLCSAISSPFWGPSSQTAALENTGMCTQCINGSNSQRSHNVLLISLCRTILSLSVVYSIGNIAMSISAIPFNNVEALNMWAKVNDHFFLVCQLLCSLLTTQHLCLSSLPTHVHTCYIHSSILAAVGMIVIALGTGGIKPCVSAFGGDQFKEGQVSSAAAVFKSSHVTS